MVEGRKENQCKGAILCWGCSTKNYLVKLATSKGIWSFDPARQFESCMKYLRRVWGEKERSMYSSVTDSIGQRFVPWGIDRSPLPHFWLAPVPVLNGSSSPIIPRYQDTSPDAESEKPELWTWGEAHLGYSCWSWNKISGGEISSWWSQEDLPWGIRSVWYICTPNSCVAIHSWYTFNQSTLHIHTLTSAFSFFFFFF